MFKETAGSDKTVYIIGDDVLARATAGATDAPKYLLYDGHGSTRQLVNSTGGTIVDSFSYDAYSVMLGGNPTRDNPVVTNLLYCREHYDNDIMI